MVKHISTKQRLKRHARNFGQNRNNLYGAPIFKIRLLPAVHSGSQLVNTSKDDVDINKKSPFIPLTVFPFNKDHLISGSIHMTKLVDSSTSAIRHLISVKNKDVLAIIMLKSSDNIILSFIDVAELISLFPISVDPSINQLGIEDSAILSIIIVLSWIEVELSSVV